MLYRIGNLIQVYCCFFMYFMLFMREFLSISLFNKKNLLEKSNRTGCAHLLLIIFWNLFFWKKRDREKIEGKT